jgi:hypothetical protein
MPVHTWYSSPHQQVIGATNFPSLEFVSSVDVMQSFWIVFQGECIVQNEEICSCTKANDLPAARLM